MNLSFYVHVALPGVSVIDHKESMCLGGVWSEVVVDVKTEGNLCGYSSFSFRVILVCSSGLSVCLGRVFCASLPMEINQSFSFCGQVRRTSCEFTICPG